MSREASGGGLALREIWGADPAVSSAGGRPGAPSSAAGRAWLAKPLAQAASCLLSSLELRSGPGFVEDLIQWNAPPSMPVTHRCRQWVLRALMRKCHHHHGQLTPGRSWGGQSGVWQIQKPGLAWHHTPQRPLWDLLLSTGTQSSTLGPLSRQ